MLAVRRGGFSAGGAAGALVTQRLVLAGILLAGVLGISQLPPWMTKQSKAEDLSISLLTFGPGETLPEWWGHSALVVEDKRLGHARLYNFGVFAPLRKGFMRHFIRGRLEFWVADEFVPHAYGLYRRRNRAIRIQEFNVSSRQAYAMAKALGTTVLPENRMYLYHHYDNNCATRPRDIIDAALGGQLKAATAVAGRNSFRKHVRRYSLVHPPMSLLLDYLQNDTIDTRITQAQEAFLPDELERQVQALRILDETGALVPLVKRQETVFQSTRPPVPQTAPQWEWRLLALGIGLGALGHVLGYWGRTGRRRLPRVLLGLLQALLGLALGTLGTLLSFMGLFTNHLLTQRNENLLLVNPLHLALLPLGIMLAFGAKRAKDGLFWVWAVLGGMALLEVVLKVLPLFNQNNWNFIALFVPINVAFAALFWLDWNFNDPRSEPWPMNMNLPPKN